MEAVLRVCASCEWIFKDQKSCPMCGFAHYSAYHTYGKRAYEYAKTQKPWMHNKVDKFKAELQEIIDNEKILIEEEIL